MRCSFRASSLQWHNRQRYTRSSSSSSSKKGDNEYVCAGNRKPSNKPRAPSIPSPPHTPSPPPFPPTHLHVNQMAYIIFAASGTAALIWTNSHRSALALQKSCLSFLHHWRNENIYGTQTASHRCVCARLRAREVWYGVWDGWPVSYNAISGLSIIIVLVVIVMAPETKWRYNIRLHSYTFVHSRISCSFCNHRLTFDDRFHIGVEDFGLYTP